MIHKVLSFPKSYLKLVCEAFETILNSLASSLINFSFLPFSCHFCQVYTHGRVSKWVLYYTVKSTKLLAKEQSKTVREAFEMTLNSRKYDVVNCKVDILPNELAPPEFVSLSVIC